MDYTREPIVETVVTPREGCKLAVRNSKGAGTEEFFVDALEVVSFGNSFFFRSIERPKSFLLPVTDYEVIEVREPRIALKHGGVDRSIKIGGGKESSKGSNKGPAKETQDGEAPIPVEPKKRERRRHHRRRRGGAEDRESDSTAEEQPSEAQPAKEKKEPRSGRSRGAKRDEAKKDEGKKAAASQETEQAQKSAAEGEEGPPPSLAVQPPPQLISETIGRYRQSEEYSEAFYDAEQGASDEPTGSEATAENAQTSTGSEEAGENPGRFRGEAEAGVGGSLQLEDSMGEVREHVEGVEEASAARFEEPMFVGEGTGAEGENPDDLAQTTRRLSFLDIVEEMSDPRA